MKHTRLTAALALASLFSLHALPARADELSDLKATVRKLMDKVDQLEADQARQKAPAPATTSTAPAGFIPVPGTSTALKIGGYVQLDAALDIKGDQGRAVSLSDLALDGSAASRRRNTSTLSARSSRLNVQTVTDTGEGPLKTRVEFDFFTSEGSETYTNSARPRLRHAYGEYGHWLAGQTWSTFMDLDSVGDTLEFNGPTGQIFIRQAQLRYTTPLAGGSLAVAIENPQTDVRDATGNAVAQDRAPDLATRWVKTADWGHVALRGLLRDLRAEDGTGQNQASTLGWGLGVSGSYKLTGADTALYQLNMGKGIGRYIQDANVASRYDATQRQLQAQKAFGGVIGVQHQWNETLRSNAMYAFTRNHNDGEAADIGGLNVRTAQAYANVIWSGVKNLDVGLEYIWGERRTQAGDKGDLSRLQGSVKYSF
jgi:hypothetical protein